MGKLHPEIDKTLQTFIESQRLFFVATAPSGEAGHINCSPKGGACLAVLAPRQVAYFDCVGSGVETIAHVRENGRIVIMFCAFQGPPKILRLHGRATVVEADSEAFANLAPRFPHMPQLGVRAIVRIDVSRISDSCGYGVPLFDYKEERPQLSAWVERKGPSGIADYKRTRNAVSIDGLPGLEHATRDKEGRDK